MSEKLLGSDYLLILLYLNGKSPIRSAVRLTKMMFLFDKQIAPVLKKGGLDSKNLPEFFPYNFGPFSKDLYEQIELFSSLEFIKVRNLYEIEEMSEVDDLIEKEFVDECYSDDDEFKSDSNYLEYSITDIGSGFVEKELLNKISGEQLEILKTYKLKITQMSLKQLLYYVYTTYPNYTGKSKIKNEVLKYGN